VPLAASQMLLEQRTRSFIHATQARIMSKFYALNRYAVLAEFVPKPVHRTLPLSEELSIQLAALMRRWNV
jgi:hypothetical protein